MSKSSEQRARKLVDKLTAKLRKPKKISGLFTVADDIDDYLDVRDEAERKLLMTELARTFAPQEDAATALTECLKYLHKTRENQASLKLVYGQLLWLLSVFSQHYEHMQLYCQVMRSGLLGILLNNLKVARYNEDTYSGVDRGTLLCSLRILLTTAAAPQAMAELRSKTFPIVALCGCSFLADSVVHALSVCVLQKLRRYDDVMEVVSSMPPSLKIGAELRRGMASRQLPLTDITVMDPSALILSGSDMCFALSVYVKNPLIRQRLVKETTLTFDLSDMLTAGEDEHKAECLELLLQLLDPEYECFWPVMKLQVETLSERLGQMSSAVLKDLARRVLDKLDILGSPTDLEPHQQHWYDSLRACSFCDVIERVLSRLFEALSTKDEEDLESVISNFDQRYRQFLLTRRHGSDRDTILFAAVRQTSLEWSLSAVDIILKGSGPKCCLEEYVMYEGKGGTQFVSPLWLACEQGRTSLVEKLLKQHGASAVSVASDGSTTLHAASCSGALDVMQVLIREGAFDSRNHQDATGMTPLIASVCSQNLEISEYLLRLAVDVNLQDRNGNSALHYAAMFDRPKFVKALLDYNANPFLLNKDGDDPVRLAYLNGPTNAGAIFLEHIDCSAHKMIEIYELLGCNCSSASASINLWQKALEFRVEEDVKLTPHGTGQHPIFDEVEDLLTKDLKLENMDNLTWCLLCLHIRQRILGPTHHSSVQQILTAGRRLANDNMDPRTIRTGLDLWKYGLHLKPEMHDSSGAAAAITCISDTISPYLDTLRYIRSLGEEILTRQEQFEDVLNLLEVTCQQASCVAATATTRPIQQNHVISVQIFWKSLLHVFDLGLVLAEHEEEQELANVFQGYAEVNPIDIHGRSLAHIVLMAYTGDSTGLTMPSPRLMALLLSSGIDPNVLDHEGKTPLQTCCQQWLQFKAFPVARTLVEHAKVLLMAGAHSDLMVRDEATCFDVLEQMNIGFQRGDHISLKCLAAKQVVKSYCDDSYSLVLPSTVSSFVRLHAFGGRD